MAGDWIPMRLDLAEDPAVVGVAIKLEMSEAEVVGHLHKLWGWANKHTADGNAASVTKTWIERYIGVTGFADALAEQGWLDCESGGIAIPNFDRYNSQSAKKRLQTANRVQRHRNDPGVTKALPEKRREEKRTEEEPSPPTEARGAAKKPARKKPSGEHHAFIEWWGAEFEKATQEEYAFEGSKDAAHVKAILKLGKGNHDTIKKRAVALLYSEDPFYAEKGVNLGLLRSQWNRLASGGRSNGHDTKSNHYKNMTNLKKSAERMGLLDGK